MKKEKTKIIVIRISIIGLCFLCFLGTFLALHRKEDPLVRYPYGTNLERQELAGLLTPDQIDDLIDAQLQPEQVIPFASQEGFILSNSAYYDQVMKAREADPGVVVRFVNQYKDRMDANQMAQALSWLTYPQLISYFESGSQIALASNPEASLIVLDGPKTLWKWQPGDLEAVTDSVYLKREAAQAWNRMKADAAAQSVDLEIVSGLIPYEQQAFCPVYASYPQFEYGTWEEQMGMTVHVRGFDEWNQIVSSMDLSAPDLSGAKSQLSEEDQKAMEWLEDHAADYGFIIRDAAGKESITGRIWQPFVLRWIGTEGALEMKNSSLSLEEYLQRGNS